VQSRRSTKRAAAWLITLVQLTRHRTIERRGHQQRKTRRRLLQLWSDHSICWI